MNKSLIKEEHGQAVLEMALVLPLFFLLLFGVIEMGQVGYTYITVNNATWNAARVASVGGTDQEIDVAVYNAAPALDSSQMTITISPPESTRQSGQEVTVTVSYPVNLLVPFLQNIIPNPIIVTGSLSARLE